MLQERLLDMSGGTKGWQLGGNEGAFYSRAQGHIQQPSLQCAVLGSTNLFMMDTSFS